MTPVNLFFKPLPSKAPDRKTGPELCFDAILNDLCLAGPDFCSGDMKLRPQRLVIQ
jgi:hypothetical protein